MWTLRLGIFPSWIIYTTTVEAAHVKIIQLQYGQEKNATIKGYILDGDGCSFQGAT